ncbi:ABC transporter permease [Thalassospira alkalitolerans]|uniref:ABC transporter permease n=1 Tax=Thalassospira alkalitolerans TaxID=1293890 RepID=A0A1Y2LEN8_9PROT|nr:ABC transporter permease [Thalassospira alkalitolerans]OSQ48271.1 hypothetical protein TALK_08230 [Thalassospira alkalitolerans]
MSKSEWTVGREVAREVAGNLRLSQGRSLLALIGIVIGTAAVITMLHLGHNAREAALRQFEILGTDQVMMQPVSGNSDKPHVPLNTVVKIPEQNIGIDAVAAVVQYGTSIRFGRSQIQAIILAATDKIYTIGKVHLWQGRLTSDLDAANSFAVIGAGIASEMTASSGRPVRIGDKINVGSRVLTIIGILGDATISPILGIDFNRTIVLPFAAARRLLPSPNISNVAALLSPGADDTQTAKAVTEYFSRHMSGGMMHVRTARQLIENIDRQMGIYAALILGIGAVSLVVGGVGIMNVMLMNVMERRQEIGLRLALGARRGHIRLMFLCEALILAIAGSAGGTFLGYLTGWVFASGSGWRFEPAPLTLPVAVGMALVVGLFFGIYPAVCAARLDPAIALRGE